MMKDNPYTDSYQVTYKEGDTSLERYSPIFKPGKSKIHTVLPGQTLQNIAHKYYGDSGSWYYIAEYNNIIEPFEELDDGQQLLIPMI